MKSLLIELKILCVKNQFRVLKSFVLSFCLVLVISLAGLSFVSLADVNDLMIGTGSNALMTMSLDDDYAVMPLSSITSITNTVDWDADRTVFRVYLYNPTTKVYINDYKYPTECSKSGGARLVYKAPDGYEVFRLFVYNVILGDYSDAPRPGTYDWDIDISSAFAHTYSSFGMVSSYSAENVTALDEVVSIPSANITTNSGDVYIGDLNVTIGSNLERFGFRMGFGGTRPTQLDLTVKESFAYAEVTDDNLTTVKPDISSEQNTENYQNDVSSSLSDLSSSVDEVNEGISGITEAIENLQGAMEPHYSNVLTQLHHITEQLHAFYDQVYNNIHLVELDILEGILAAIENMDLEVNVELGGLKQTIERVSSEIQANDNKLAAEQIANDEANTEEIKDAVEEHGNFIIDGLKGLFIPSDEFFKSYFDDLYEYFSDRFGFLSFPFDLLARFVDLVVNSSDVDCVLTLPSFEIMGEQLLYENSFNLTEFLEQNFGFLLSAIRMGTSIILIMSFVQLCGDKWKEVMNR